MGQTAAIVVLALSLVLPWASAEDPLWESVNGPFPGGGASDFLIAPDGAYYASSWLLGVARSTDRGETWTPWNTGLPKLQVDSLSVNALGEPMAGVSGLTAPDNALSYRFTGGQWRLASGPTANIRIRNFGLSASGAVFCATQWEGDIFRSTDHGTTFTRVADSKTVTGALGHVHALGQAPDGTLYAGGEADGIWRSTDDGQTWQVFGLQFSEGYNGNLWSIGNNLQGEVLAVGKGKDGAGIFRLRNSDNSWVASIAGMPAWVHARSLTERPDAGGHLFCGTSKGVFRSSDGGASWSLYTTGLPMKTATEFSIVFTLVHDAQGYLHARTENGLLFRTRQPTAVGNQAPSVNAGVDQTITLPATAALDGTVSDDGMPNPPGALTIGWSKVGGPGQVSFGNTSAADTTVSFSTAGSYTLRLTATDGAMSRNDEVDITVQDQAPVNQPPVIQSYPWANPNIVILPAAAAVAVTASDPDSGPANLTYSWSLLSGPGTVTFTPNGTTGSENSAATFSSAGVFVVRVTVSDGLDAVTADLSITAQGAPPPAASVSVQVADGVASEPGTDTGKFRLKRSGDLSAPLTVFYAMGGSATPGADYAVLPGSATFSAGAANVTVTLHPSDDGQLEKSETVALNVLPGPGYAPGTPASATLLLLDDEWPIVTLIATDPDAAEPSEAGAFTLSRRGGDLAQPLTVSLKAGGSATAGEDYTSLPASAVFPPHIKAVALSVAPRDDTAAENTERVTLSLVAGPAYQVGTTGAAVVNILDNE